jgi:hypothetical protein
MARTDRCLMRGNDAILHDVAAKCGNRDTIWVNKMILAIKGVPIFDTWDNLIVAVIAAVAIIVGAAAVIRSTRSNVRADAYAGYIDDEAINRGSGSVSIKGIRMLVPPRFYNGYLYPMPLPAEVMKGPKLPYTLKGEDSEEWSIQPHMALEFYETMNEQAPSTISPRAIRLMKRNVKLFSFMRIRAQIDLGNGRPVKSAWTIGWSWAGRVAAELPQLQIAEAERRKKAASEPRPSRPRQDGSRRFKKKRTSPKKGM